MDKLAKCTLMEGIPFRRSSPLKNSLYLVKKFTNYGKANLRVYSFEN